jgi:cellobiose dehydrogenase (acceptor)
LSTPRLLWNSGIGRSDALQIVQSGAAQTGVTLPAAEDWIDLPVGRNLQNHAQVLLQFTDMTNFTAYNFNNVAVQPNAGDLSLEFAL